MIRKVLYRALVAVVALGVASCRTDREAPTVDELFDLVPEKTENVVAVNFDSCTFMQTLVPEAILPYVNHTDAVLYTLNNASTTPVLVMRATDPVALGQAAYDWMQVPIEGSDGQHLLAMYTKGKFTAFTDSRFAWLVPSDGAKETMKTVLNTKGGYKTAEALRLTRGGSLRDAASGLVTNDGVQVPLVAHVGLKTLQVLTGECAKADTTAMVTTGQPGVTATVAGSTAMTLMRKLTTGLSLSQQLAVNAVMPYLERAGEVQIKLQPGVGMTMAMRYDKKVIDAEEVENSLAKLAASAGYHGLVDTTPDNGVTLGPIEMQFDCQAGVNVTQDVKAPPSQPSFAIDITVPGSLTDLLSTAPLNSF